MPKERLAEYRRKRDPAETPEPFSGRKRGKEPIFVVQRHDSRRLHYDFRLERDGALASWAVPKGVPLEPGQQHLAVHVEDHPIEYASFEGEIPKGQYGAGTVEIWDQGTYELVEEKKNGGLTVRLHGKRLDGVWTLVPAKLDGDPKNWLIIRKREDGARPARARYAPMLATLAEAVPKGADWLFEVKWDGYRALIYVEGGEATLRSRNDNDLTGRFPGVARAVGQATKSPDCVLDGEVGALDENGRMTFSAMQQGRAGTSHVYVAFDLLEVDGEPIIDLPLTERRERLERLLDRRNKTVQLSETFDDGEALFRAAEEQGFEGIIAKRAESRYLPGKRSRDWLKIKTHGEQEFIVAGYTRGKGRRASGFGSLVLAVRDGEELRYVGNVGTGFTDAEIGRLLERLRPLERDTPPFPEVPKMPRVRKSDVVWVEPKLVAQVAFAEWTHDGHLRAPRYKGLREDKPAEEVEREEPVLDLQPQVQEEPLGAEIRRGNRVVRHAGARLKSGTGLREDAAGPAESGLPTEVRKGRRVLRLSNLDKVFFPDDGITKGDLLRYYRDVAPVLIPHLKDRPFTMKRYPDGINGDFFFQKDAPKHMPEWIPRRKFWASTRERPPQRRLIEFALVNDELALLWMVNMGCIDMNTWYSRVDKPDRPDWVLFDLDPSPDVGFAETIQVALLVKQALDALGLVSFPKTSGSEGMHVLVPIQRRYTYDDTREFAEIVARAIARSHRGLATTEWTKSKRRGVLIDSNQNGEGKTIASVYSVRPKPGAPVSTPLRWDEVNEKLNPSIYTMDVVLDRVRRYGDLFEGVLKTRQSLGAALSAPLESLR